MIERSCTTQWRRHFYYVTREEGIGVAFITARNLRWHGYDHVPQRWMTSKATNSMRLCTVSVPLIIIIMVSVSGNGRAVKVQYAFVIHNSESFGTSKLYSSQPTKLWFGSILGQATPAATQRHCRASIGGITAASFRAFVFLTQAHEWSRKDSLSHTDTDSQRLPESCPVDVVGIQHNAGLNIRWWIQCGLQRYV